MSDDVSPIQFTEYLKRVADAERYEWLRDPKNLERVYLCLNSTEHSTVDSAVDFCRAEQ